MSAEVFHPPDTAAVPDAAIEHLACALRDRRIVALTGAGCSTESGIPDYRGPGRRAAVRRPIQHLEFVTRPEVRARYWARSVLGWPVFATPRPNAAHRALADLERAGILAGVITQNVDRLHQSAGSNRVIELHGALTWVRCLDCGAAVARSELQHRLVELNPGFASAHAPELRPDGDADLPPEAERAFQVPSCESCGGVLKPDVVFFGANVPTWVVAAAFELLERGDALLVVGSSLAVYSGYRFVARAAARRTPIAIVNLGETRADRLAAARLEARAGDVLPRLASALGA